MKDCPQSTYPNLIHFLIESIFISTVEAIKIDLPRTFPENIVFGRYRWPLFNVLIAAATYNPDIGYCQGLNYIAGEENFIVYAFIIISAADRYILQ